MKKKILIGLICVCLLISFSSFIFAVENVGPGMFNIPFGEIIDIPSSYGFNTGEITGMGILIRSRKGDFLRVDFVVGGAVACIKENCFRNIVPITEKRAYIDINNSNLAILKAYFTTNNESGTYIINNRTLDLPPNTDLYFDGEKINIEVPDGTDLTSFPNLFEFIFGSSPTIIKGKDITISEYLKFKEGELKLIENGYEFKGEEITYKGIKTRSTSPIIILNEKNEDPKLRGLHLFADDNEIQIINNLPKHWKAKDSFIEFTPENKIFDISEKSKFSIIFDRSERATEDTKNILTIKKRENLPPLLEQVTQGDPDLSDIRIINDGHVIRSSFYAMASYPLSHLELGLKETLSGEYQPVELELQTDSIDMIDKKIIIDSGGELSLIDTKGEERVVYKRQGLSEVLKNGVTEEQYNDYINKYNAIVDYDYFGYIQSTKTTEEFILNSIKAGINPNQMGNILQKLKDEGKNNFIYIIQREISEWGYYGLNGNQIEDITKKVIEESRGTPSEREGLDDDISSALKEYNGENYEDVKTGLLTAIKYSPRNYGTIADLSKRLGLKYTNIKDKETLAKEIASSFNKYVEEDSMYISKGSIRLGGSIRLRQAAVMINSIHDMENMVDGTDNIREEIINGLDFKTKYYLISQANEDLYTSTFLKMYETFPENAIERIREDIDPSGENWVNFVFQMGSRNKASELLEQNPGFFVDAIEKGLENPEGISKKGVFLTDTFTEFYENPQFKKEKEYFEKLLIEGYENAETMEQKGVLGYLIKLNEEERNSNNLEYKKIYDELPKLPNRGIQKKWVEDNEIAAKFYYYNDETWFDASIIDYQKYPYNYNLIEKTDTTATLIKEVNGKTLRVVMTNDNSDVQEAIDGDEFDMIAHRGHSFHLDETFNGQSNKEKILYLGSCGSFGETPGIQKKYPNAHIISDEDIGHGAVNNWATYQIMYRLANGANTWEKIDSDSLEKHNLVFPHDKSQLILTYIKQVEEQLRNRGFLDRLFD